MGNARNLIRTWLYTGAGLVFLMVVVGGITRLTGSGLSMSDWNLIMDAIPPMNEEEWNEAFAFYKEFPQYQKLNRGMSLDEFKVIFFWEYLHRLLARLLGIVFIIPFAWFWLKGRFTPRNLRRMFILLALGALQGLMGWIMVKSGLVDVPYVSHIRLAAHFLLAVLIIGLCVWYARDLDDPPLREPFVALRKIKPWSIAVLVLFFLQITWGAFTAGLHAGFMHNTFPLMSGGVVPPGAWTMEPWILNLVENPGTVQWVHRVLGTVLLAAVFVLWRTVNRSASDRIEKTRVSILLAIIVLQYVLGVLTVLFRVPIFLGVTHQAVAIIFWLQWLVFYHGLIKVENCLGESRGVLLQTH